mmetsp:Transcript_9252/g.19903  ORF Transcript_9252/g.19903 Transcript_9252/m.19903 type:complete len:97 (+) Transcript_9252:426-716(+)
MMGWTPPNGPLRPPSTRTVFLHDGGLHIGATSPDSRLHVFPEIDFLRNKSKEVLKTAGLSVSDHARRGVPILRGRCQVVDTEEVVSPLPKGYLDEL